jgi:hypothetical protein
MATNSATAGVNSVFSDPHVWAEATERSLLQEVVLAQQLLLPLVLVFMDKFLSMIKSNLAVKESAFQIQDVRQIFNKGADFVTDAAVMNERLFFVFCSLGERGRIVELDVNNLRFSGKTWTGFLRATANCNHEFKFVLEQFPDSFGCVSGNINAGLAHHGDGSRINNLFFSSGGENLETVSVSMPRPAFGHLASAGIVRAKKQYIFLFQRVSFMGLCKSGTSRRVKPTRRRSFS